MTRREFLEYCMAAGMAVGVGGLTSYEEAGASLSQEDMNQVRGLRTADAHAHPYQLHGITRYDSTTPTLEMMKTMGMVACSFSAVGDMTKYRGHSGTPYGHTLHQLRMVRQLEDDKKLKRVLKASDIKSVLSSDNVLGAVMAIEGADALESDIENLNRFYDYGVRLITLLHDHNNGLGFHQRSQSDGPLTPFGAKVVERMNELGMVIDLAHAKSQTLKGVVEISKTPVIDSHTNPLPYGYETKRSGRLRTWPEMELIAKTGGVICTWPYAVSTDKMRRTTLKHWAEEILQMKTRLGIEHCGLGTDGGGAVPNIVSGWNSIASLPKLVAAMREVGLSQDDIAAYAGGNFLRVLNRILG